MYYENEDERQAAYYNNADLVLQGIPMEEGAEKSGLRHYSISVQRVWKGRADDIIDVATALDSAGCGIRFEIDEPVIIFAYQSNKQYHTGLCSGTEQSNDLLVQWLNTFDGTVIPTLKEPPEDPRQNCDPYECKDGDTFPRCSGKSAIVYKMHPCEISDKEFDERQNAVQGDFVDVPKGHRNYTSISFIKREGIAMGYDGGLYKPDDRINRAEFTKIIIKANYDATAIDSCEAIDLFSDVSQNDWFANFICIAKKDGVIDGYPSGAFLPQDFVNFAEAAKIVVGAFGIETNPEDHLGIWWRPYVFALAHIGGLPSTFSDPNQQITRGDMAEIIYRVMIGMEY
jgi:hypothetical protein